MMLTTKSLRNLFQVSLVRFRPHDVKDFVEALLRHLRSAKVVNLANQNAVVADSFKVEVWTLERQLACKGRFAHAWYADWDEEEVIAHLVF